MGWGNVHSGMGRCTQWDGEMYIVVGWEDVHSGGMDSCTQWDGEIYAVGWEDVHSGIG